MIVYADYRAVPDSMWPWRNFTPAEFASRDVHHGAIMVEPGFMDRLQRLRDDFGRPMPVTSGYRTPEHNQRVSSTGLNGPHTSGRAADIAVVGKDALDLIFLAVKHGFTGIGVRQHGPHPGRFVHLDDLAAGPRQPRPWLWTYA